MLDHLCTNFSKSGKKNKTKQNACFTKNKYDPAHLHYF